MDYQDYQELFEEHGVPIELKHDDDFLKIRETLTRIGVSSSTNDTLWQSCHILHKRGKYAILHFKELFELDGKASSLTTDDLARRNTIAKLLDEWGLCDRLFPEKYDKPLANLSQIKIVKARDKQDWNLVPKYTIGGGNKQYDS